MTGSAHMTGTVSHPGLAEEGLGVDPDHEMFNALPAGVNQAAAPTHYIVAPVESVHRNVLPLTGGTNREFTLRGRVLSEDQFRALTAQWGVWSGDIQEIRSAASRRGLVVYAVLGAQAQGKPQ